MSTIEQNDSTTYAANELEQTAAATLEQFAAQTKALPSEKVGDQPFEASHQDEHVKKLGEGVLEVTSAHGLVVPGEGEGYAIISSGETPTTGGLLGKKYDEEMLTPDRSAHVDVSTITNDPDSLSSMMGVSPSPEGSQVTSFIETKPSVTHGGEIRRRVSVVYNENGKPMINTNQVTTDADGNIVRERDWMSYPDGGGSSDTRYSKTARRVAKSVADRVAAKVTKKAPLNSERDKKITEVAPSVAGKPSDSDSEKASLL